MNVLHYVLYRCEQKTKKDVEKWDQAVTDREGQDDSSAINFNTDSLLIIEGYCLNK